LAWSLTDADSAVMAVVTTQRADVISTLPPATVKSVFVSMTRGVYAC